MRRKEKEISNHSDIESVIRQSAVCRVAMSENNIPYIVPMSFGYQDNALYVHSGLEGKKINILKKNPAVCFEFDIHSQVVESKVPCNWGMKYRSVVGFGKAQFLDTLEDKRFGLDIIMHHYSNISAEFSEKAIDATAVIKINITRMTGKQSGF